MAIITIDKPNITLLRLVANNQDSFYKQDWYYDQEFANYPIPVGDHIVDEDHPPTAAMLAWLYLADETFEDTGVYRKLRDTYYWTADFDDEGNRIYVGKADNPKYGLQIHRHLANPKVEVW